ncbi:MAG: substrate-binding domain-containing protein [Victivallales bacterium]
METRRRIGRHEMENVLENLSSSFYRDVILKKKINSPLLSVTELAAAYDISVSTARKFYHKLQRTGVIGAEHRKGYFLKDPTFFHSQWKDRKEIIIGLIGYLDVKHPFAPYNHVSQILGVLEKMANEHGWRVQFFNTYPVEELAPEILSSIERERGDLRALLYLPFASPGNAIEKLHELGIPLLTAGDFSEFATCISYDNRQIGSIATAYLLELGHRRIAHVTYSGSDWCDERRRAYMETLTSHGVMVKDKLVVEVVRDDESSYIDCINNLKNQHITAIFCANDEIALGLVDAGEKAGWRLHGAVAMIGVDDDIKARHMDLSTVQKNSDAIGVAAFKALVNHFDCGEPLPKRILLNGSVLKRGSTEFISTMGNKEIF